jgi:hypothetical protein
MTKTINRLERRDWLVAVLFFLLTMLSYAPLRTRYAYLWDSVEFVEAIRDYNVALSQPHAPGYFLYIMLGRLVNTFVGDPHSSLVWISVVAGAGLVAILYLLGAALFGRSVGVVTGLMAWTSPLIWFFSCVALTYVLDAFLVCVLVLWCWRAAQHGGSWLDAVGLGSMLAVIAGVRQQSLFGLVPLAVFTLWQFKSQRGLKMAAALLACVVVLAAWFSALLRMTGGWATYSAALTQIAQFHAHKTLAVGGWQALLWNVFFAGLYCVNGIMLGALALPMAFRRDRNANALRHLAIWGAPVFLLAVAVGYSEAPGHVFTYLPCLLLLCGAGVARTRRPALAAAAVCGFNLFVFLAWPRAWDPALWGTIPKARVLRAHDALIANTTRLIREQYRPDETILCHEHGDLFFGLRHFQIYLPEFPNYREDRDHAMVTPTNATLLRAWKGRLEYVERMDLTGKRVALLVVPPGQKLQQFSAHWDVGRARPVEGSGGTLYALPVDAAAGKSE